MSVELESWTPVKRPACKCLECCGDYKRTRVDQNFCTPECKRNYHNREQLRGKRVYRALYHWRKSRGQDSKAQFTLLCREVDAWVAEDRKAGRSAPPVFTGD